MVSMSICKTEQELLASRRWEQCRLEEDGVRETEQSVSLCYKNTCESSTGHLLNSWEQSSPFSFTKLWQRKAFLNIEIQRKTLELTKHKRVCSIV